MAGPLSIIGPRSIWTNCQNYGQTRNPVYYSKNSMVLTDNLQYHAVCCTLLYAAILYYNCYYSEPATFRHREPSRGPGKPDLWHQHQAEVDRWAGGEPEAAAGHEGSVWGEAGVPAEQDTGDREREGQSTA